MSVPTLRQWTVTVRWAQSPNPALPGLPVWIAEVTAYDPVGAAREALRGILDPLAADIDITVRGRPGR